MNEPIAYDDHGEIPFDVPFGQIRPNDISIYLQLNTKVGRSTCRQACAHCFFINQPEARGRSMDLREGRQVMDDLARIGYRVFPMISDSFANDGEFLALFGNTHNRDLRQEVDRNPTKTMRRGDLWTSGAPLLDENWAELLGRSLDHGFGSVTITFHGVLDADLRLLPHDAYPIERVFPGHRCVEVIARIHSFNRTLTSDARLPLDVNIGVTVGKHNHGREHLVRYARYFNRLPVAVVRFNCFHDHGWRHPHLTLTPDEVAQVYRDLKWLHGHMPLRFQLGVDEDFGTSGIEVMGFPGHTGWCRAGRQLFAVVPDRPVVVDRNERRTLEKVGSIAACVDAFKPICGRLVRQTDTATATAASSYWLEFDHGVLDALNQKRVSGVYTDGCFANEMLRELRPV